MSIPSIVIAVALASAFIVMMFVMMAVIIYQRWRICDNNAHLSKFIDENQRLRRMIHYEGRCIRDEEQSIL